MPVPPLETAKEPIHWEVKVWVLPDEVITMPRLVSEVVAKVWEAPVWSWPKGPRDVIPPPPTQTPFTAKQPEARLIPLEKVEVAVSEMYEPVPMPSKVALSNGKVEVADVEVATKYFAIRGSVEVTTLKAFKVLPDQARYVPAVILWEGVL